METIVIPQHELVARSENPPQADGSKSSIRNYDIVCGRDSAAFNNIGNRRFRVTISLNAQRYIDAGGRHEKKMVIQSVYDLLIKGVGARFLKTKAKDSDDFIVLGERDVRNKIQHALRDMAASLLSEDYSYTDERESLDAQSTGELAQILRMSPRRISRSPSEVLEAATTKFTAREDKNKLSIDDPSEIQDDISLSQLVPILEEERMVLTELRRQGMHYPQEFLMPPPQEDDEDGLIHTSSNSTRAKISADGHPAEPISEDDDNEHNFDKLNNQMNARGEDEDDESISTFPNSHLYQTRNKDDHVMMAVDR